jgi:hypothetical protein
LYGCIAVWAVSILEEWQGDGHPKISFLTNLLDFVADESHCFSGPKFQTCWTMSPCVTSVLLAHALALFLTAMVLTSSHVQTTFLSPLHGFPFASWAPVGAVGYIWTMVWWGLGEEDYLIHNDWHILTTIYTFFWYVLSYHTAFLFLIVAVGQVRDRQSECRMPIAEPNSTICFH